MDLALTDDQSAILSALDALVRPYEAPSLGDGPFVVCNGELDRALKEGGFLDVAAEPDLGDVTAALIVERLARLPVASEVAASILVGPLLGEGGPRPVCLVEARRWRRPVRFLAEGVSVVVLEDDRVSLFMAGSGHFEPAPDALFAYPVALLRELPADRQSLGLDPERLRSRWRSGLAAESAGLLAGALASTVAHVSERHQFGRPIATFQAVRHRLAEAQVLINGLFWLAMKAAETGDAGDAAIAALHAQFAARTCVYDFHQFLGAMGMTLEHPLHLWTYRLKLLGGELGGSSGQGLAAADALWGAADAQT